MSSIKDKKSEYPRYNIMEEEDKINIEEATVNLSCVKKELEEYEFAENQYRIALTYENVFGHSLKEKKENIDSLIGFLDDDVIMETEMGTIKLEDVKDEDRLRKIIKQSCCNGCSGNYEGYCPNCSSLSHILNNVTPNINTKSDLNTIPIDILEIREISMRNAVFSLKTIPEGIILGPFEGTASIKQTNGLKWKIKDKKLVNDQNANWMKYIENVANPLLKNLDIFQFDGLLYFETSREIPEGEELLVCYCEEKKVLKSDNHEESYLVPVVKELPKVFACTLCCLGFYLEQCLVEHKTKCPQADHGSSITDFEVIQCCCCKVWLEKQEHLSGHMLHCLNYYNKLPRSLQRTRRTNADKFGTIHGNAEQSTSIDFTHTGIIHSKQSHRISGKTHSKRRLEESTVTIQSSMKEKKYKCSKCPYQTKYKASLKRHLITHNDIKNFQCDICKKAFNRKIHLKMHVRGGHLNTTEKEYKCSDCSFQTNYKLTLIVHVKDQHSNTSEKEHKCSECPYQTNRKGNLKMHLNTHKDIKPFECGICKNRFSVKRNLKVHVKYLHLSTKEKEYKCSECPFQTNYKQCLKEHIITHSGIKNFQCEICKKKFTQKRRLRMHLKDHHSNTTKKEYKCSECSFQTNYKVTLRVHIKDKHSNTSEREYKCSECSYQTNRQGTFAMHLNTHIKPFECGVCKKKFAQKRSLRMHLKNYHSNTTEKEYKCTECSYQTNYKQHIKDHLITHSGVKSFECDVCKKSFSFKSNLKEHVKNLHSNTSKKNIKKYKCSECPYQTNLNGNLTKHLNTHKNIMPFKCDVCQTKFGRKNNLKLHIKKQHSDLTRSNN